MAWGRGGSTPHLLLPWLVLATGCTAIMWLSPGEETIPYHVAWIGLGLAYGFDPWPPRTTAVAIVAYTLATGAILITRAATGVIPWEETGEIPLMCILVALMIWHVRRRMAALDALRRIATAESRHAAQRERLSRLTTHEMRTTLTVASGYVDLLMERERRPGRLADLEVVRDELHRLNRAGERFLRLFRVQDRLPLTPVDLDDFLRETAHRWSTVAERAWVVDSAAGKSDCSTERLRTCLDTLIENALRYTSVGATVRLVGFRTADAVCLGVADSGSGLQPDLAAAINADGFGPAPDAAGATPDPLSQTGLGLALVHEVVASRDGRLVAGRSAEGGALVLMMIPVAAAEVAPTAARYAVLGQPVPA